MCCTAILLFLPWPLSAAELGIRLLDLPRAGAALAEFEGAVLVKTVEGTVYRLAGNKTPEAASATL